MPRDDTINADIGRTLLDVQRIERILAGCLMCATGTSSADAQLKKLLERDRETLGRLLNEFRKLVSLPRDFEEALSDLLESRNVFIHRLMIEDWVDLTTPKGRKVLRQFL